jgi:hypothetical protein
MGIRVRNFITKLTNWEYWPYRVVYTPIFFYWLWLSIRARSLLFFTASNPGIELGGMFGESKNAILEMIPSEYCPETLLFESTVNINELKGKIVEQAIKYPFIAKPDVGERGLLVEKVNDELELQAYLDKVNVDFLIQEYIDLPEEVGIFYYRIPGEEKGTVSSIVIKELLFIVGDGSSSVGELMKLNDRALLQVEALKKKKPELLAKIPKAGESVEIEAIGNHNRGTKFINGNRHITERLTNVFDELSRHVNGFYYGRYDIRCKSIDAIVAGEGFKVLELNGAKSEPAHIYHPGFSIWKGYQSLFHHWKILFTISRINHRNGTPYLSFRDGLKEFRGFLAYNKFARE